MFCGKCGTENKEGAGFCTNCGAKLNQGADARAATIRHLPNQNDKNRKVGMLAVAAAAVVIVILGMFLFGGRSYKATIETYMSATFDADAEELFELIPDNMIDYMLKEDGYSRSDLDSLLDEVQETLQDELDSLDRYLGEGWEIDYEILYTEDLKGDDLDDIKDSYEDADIKVSAAKEVEVEITVTAEDTENSNSMDISLIKVGRSWYLDVMSMGSLF